MSRLDELLKAMGDPCDPYANLDVAAAEIDRLTAEVERLRKALKEHACKCDVKCVDCWEGFQEAVKPEIVNCAHYRARAALKEASDDKA
jgi:hypothetical protein